MLHFEVPPGTVALEAEVRFDPDALEFLGAATSREDVLANGGVAGDRLTFGAITADPRGGALASASFRVARSAAPEVVRAQAYDLNGAPLADTTSRSSYESSAPAVDDIPVSFGKAVSTGDPTLAAAFADYPLGDLNRSGEVNVLDALEVLKILAEASAPPSDYELYSADLDGSGVVEIFDAHAALRKATELTLGASLIVRPGTLALEEGETGVLLIGNAGNRDLSFDIGDMRNVTLTRVGGVSGQSAAFEVTPQSGAKSGFLSVVTQEAGNASVALRVGDEPLPAAGKLSVTPASLDFGPVLVGEQEIRDVTLTNTGGTGDPSITVSGATLSGDFSTTFSGPVSLAPGGSVTLEVTFSPASAGELRAQLEVAHNAQSTPSPLVLDLSGGGASEPAFGASTLFGADPVAPTSLQFGPDGRLYVAGRFGEIYIYTVARRGANDYRVTATETLQEVKAIVNHDDDGDVNRNVNERQVTGLFVAGTALSPVLYVSSSDPRVGAGGGGADLGLDTNSGVISKLVCASPCDDGPGNSWSHVQLVRGLPRSEQNHATNGLQLDAANRTLYVAQGGHANAGAPSNNFAFTTEYALSAAVLSIDLEAIDDLPARTDRYGQMYKYNVPTLDDPARSNDGDEDAGDPFGGNDGLNQAKLVPGGPVQIYASGFRNLYDIVITKRGRMYGVDNGANTSWGGFPQYEESFGCTNAYLSGEPGSTSSGPEPSGYPASVTLLPGSDGRPDAKVNNKNGLHFIRDLNGKPYYGGHPAPIRGNPAGAGLFKDSAWYGPDDRRLPADWPPVPTGYANPVECDFQNSGVDDPAIANYGPSTNGVTEYTAGNFGGAMRGDILSVGYTSSGVIFRAVLSAAGDAVETCTDLLPNTCDVKLAEGFGNQTLDLTAQGDDGIFGGTVWVTNIAGGINVLEPADYSGSDTGGGGGGGAGNPTCQALAARNPSSDEDDDGYSNGDEADNATNPCNPASLPADNDGDNLSDLNDADDDNDGIVDVDDPFALDASNGAATALGLELTFEGQQDGGFGGSGFTGWMTNGSADYLEQFSPEFILAGGATGIFGVEKVTAGDAYRQVNTQENGFQFGINVSDRSGVFVVESQINGPFFDGQDQQDYQSQGIQIGAGDQDNYLKLVLNGDSFQVLTETSGQTAANTFVVSGARSADAIKLYLVVDPVAGTVQPQVALDGGVQPLGDPVQLSGALLAVVQGDYAVEGKASRLAVGVISTSAGPGPVFSANWQYLKVVSAP